MMCLDICSGTNTVTSSGTIITSPGWNPVTRWNYPSYQDCEIRVQFEEGKSVVIEFLGNFHIEPSSTCSFDYIEFFGDPSLDFPVTAKFCGSSIPDKKEWKGNSIIIKFYSDDSYNYEGFSLKVIEKAFANGKININPQ